MSWSEQLGERLRAARRKADLSQSQAAINRGHSRASRDRWQPFFGDDMEMTTPQPIGDVTYSPQDDKLRVYFALRQDPETIAPLKQAGFRWAGKQECWQAHWNPDREDTALAVTGAAGIDDEPSTLGSRAGDRAERFAGYASNAAAERDARQKRASAIGDAINGQPVLVGHHSERRHRRDLRRMQDDMVRACDAHKRSGYWSSRAAGSVRWAAYKARADVRARRIKKLEADLRRCERLTEAYGIMRKFWVGDPPYVAALDFCDVCPEQPYGSWSKLDAVRGGSEEDQAGILANVQADSIELADRAIAKAERWREHYKGRIGYERAQLEQQDGDLGRLEKPKRPKAPPILNYRAERIDVQNIYTGATDSMAQVEMSKGEYAAIWKDYKATRLSADGSHRVRSAMVSKDGQRVLALVFLTDSKVHDNPEVTQ